VCVTLLFTHKRAWYGRYTTNTGYGPLIPGKLSWMLQESPCVIVPLIFLYYANPACLGSPINMLIIAMFLIHYIQRALIYPLLIQGGKPTPLLVFFLALLFCTTNSVVQMHSLTLHHVYTLAEAGRVALGIVIFFLGMAINVQSDAILRNLRKPGETGYKIPRGGMFEYVSGANFFGEIVEWAGYAIACWSLSGFSFWFFTLCNIGPRGYHHHQWYLQKFKGEYPKERKAIIPFIV